MDDLDRLYFECVEILRRERPGALNEPFSVWDLHDEVIPYRRVRNPVGFVSNDDYEVAMSRLLSGERGYLLGDPTMQEELRAGLEESLPDIRRYLAFPDTKVRLDPEKIPPPGHIRYAPPEMRERTQWEDPSVAADDAIDSVSVDSGSASGSASGAAAEAQVEPSLVICPKCGVDLPELAAFCPFCGCRLSPETCSSCGANLEPAWIFCAKCGAARRGTQPDSA
jgi:hypothetical protein